MSDPAHLPTSLTHLRLRCDPSFSLWISFLLSLPSWTALQTIYLSAPHGGPMVLPPELEAGVQGVEIRRGEEWDFPREEQEDAPFREDFARFVEVVRSEGARVE